MKSIEQKISLQDFEEGLTHIDGMLIETGGSEKVVVRLLSLTLLMNLIKPKTMRIMIKQTSTLKFQTTQ